MAPLIPIGLSLLPSLAKWIVGDKAGEVTEQITNVIASVTGTSDPIGASLVLADPLKAAEVRIRLAEIEAERESSERNAFLADISGARNQTVSLAQAGSKIAWAPVIISTMIVSGFFLCTLALVFLVREWDERTANLLLYMFGVLSAGFVQVNNYWLGSSSGSKRSGDAVRAIVENQTDRLNTVSLTNARRVP